AAAVAGADGEPAALNALARAVARIDPAAGEQQMAAALAAALDGKDYSAAAVAASYLVGYWRDAGRLGEALHLADDKAGYTRLAGLGAGTQLLDQGRRAQIFPPTGPGERMLDEVERLRERMDSLPTASAEPETAQPWNVREMLLDTGRYAAAQLGRWAEALELGAAVVASKRSRDAPDSDIAWAQANDYGPLLRL